jgi:hypothetical protein
MAKRWSNARGLLKSGNFEEGGVQLCLQPDPDTGHLWVAVYHPDMDGPLAIIIDPTRRSVDFVR